jgi:hypothetical protein
VLIDANLLLYAADSRSPFHARAAAWLEEVLAGPSRVGFPWPTLTAFLRISTHPRALDAPLDAASAWAYVDAWLAAEPAWIPTPTERHAAVLKGLLGRYDLRGNLVTDAHLAALAIEHGLQVCSADTDFARFSEIRWLNPLA